MAGSGCSRRNFLKTLSLGAAAVVLYGRTGIAAALAGGKRKVKPNIILFLTDDQGWTGTSVQMMAGRFDSKSYFYQTPALERMAKEGMTFSNAYSPAPICSPARHSIQFGKTPARLKHTSYGQYRSRCRGEISIAQVIKAVDAGYVTAHFGKWDIFRSTEDLGYDKSDGRTSVRDGNFDRKTQNPLAADDPKRIFSLAKRANDFIEQHVKAQRPFYMQISHYAVHVQHQALETTKQKYRNLLPANENDPELVAYAAMTENLDTSLGMLLEKVDKLGITESTYIIYTSDNGSGFRHNSPLKEGKGTLWEGGIRVPMIVRGPGIQPGSRCNVPVVGWDFLPTFADLVRSKKPLPGNIDGASLRPLFENSGRGIVKRPRDELVFHFPSYNSPQSAIRRGDYKLIQNWRTRKTSLFNLADDIEEAENLADEMPEKVGQFNEMMIDYLESVKAENVDEILRECPACPGKRKAPFRKKRRMGPGEKLTSFKDQRYNNGKQT